MKALGLYVHIPFCTRKCAYCDFVSFPGCEYLIDSYIEAVIAEARLYEETLSVRRVDSVFIGGGTPSLLSHAQFEKLITGLAAYGNWDAPEVTVEANPETLDTEKLAAYAACGVNRISIGLQTHENAILKRIGRGHTWEMFLKAFKKADECFGNINIDTIFGLPGQTLEGYVETMKRVISLSPKHVSAYALKVEPRTPLARAFSGADEDLDRAMYHTGIEMLDASGRKQYETSNFALSGYECRHNLKYWTGCEYLGLGVASHSCLRMDEPVRFSNTMDLGMYLSRAGKGWRPVVHSQVVSPDEDKAEYIMLRLRLNRGLSYCDYQDRFKKDFRTEFAYAIEKVERAGLIIKSRDGISPTIRGFDLQNALIGEFIKII